MQNTRKSPLKKCIIKLAVKCAIRFENQKFDQEPQTMMEYCTKKLKKLSKSYSYPEKENEAFMKNILNVFDQIYYNGEGGRTPSSLNFGNETALCGADVKDQYENGGIFDQSSTRSKFLKTMQ